MINSNLDIDGLREKYLVDNKVRIPNFLDVKIAERISELCNTTVPYDLQYVIDGKYQSKSEHELSRMGQETIRKTNQAVASAASQGIGFLYQGYLKSRAVNPPTKRDNQGLAFLHEVFDSFDSSSILDIIRQISGVSDINGSEPQYTRYLPGHFLTRHRDEVIGRKRKLAFVLSLTKFWHPDWGGLLQFYSNNGKPRDVWMPEFNTLSLFDVRHVHAVTYVTPFAAAPRLSLTGWFVNRS